MDKKDLRGNGIYVPRKNTTDIDPEALFESVTYDIHEMLFRIIVYTSNKKYPSFLIDFDGTNTTKHLEITTKYSATFGRCFSFHPKDDVRKLGVRHIDIIARIDIYIYFGHPGQFMYITTKSKVKVYV